MVSAFSAASLNLTWMSWKFTGVSKDPKAYKGLYGLYAVVITLAVSIWYPLHLSLKLFSSDSMSENFKNMSIVLTCVACTIKFVIYARNQWKVQELEAILLQLDARVQGEDEVNYLNKTSRTARIIASIFICAYIILGCSILMSCIFRYERSLVYPGWYPFDELASLRNYCFAMSYQFLGAAIQVVQNYASDTFPPLTLYLLSRHVRLLGMRVAKIGHKSFNLAENEKELLRCIGDQKNLYKIRDIIEDVISMPMFIQFGITAINICTVMGAVLFFDVNFADRIQFIVFLTCLVMQIAPACYYGSESEIMFGELHRWIFSSNWGSQSRVFKKHMILFTERCHMKTTVYAGGMLKINLGTLLGVFKTTYSLCTVVYNIRN